MNSFRSSAPLPGRPIPHSHPEIARRSRRAWASALLAATLGAALIGCTAPQTAPATGTTSPSVSSPTAAQAATPIPSPARHEFDKEAVYAACDAAVQADVRAGEDPLPPGPIGADSFGPAASDPYTAEHTNGDPNAIYVNVQYFRADVFQFSGLCVASGEPAAPRVEFIRTLD